MKRLGLDIGSTTVKCVVADEAQNILFSRYERHLSRIQEASAALLGEAAARFPGEEMLFAMSGSAGMGMAADLALPFVQEVYATRTAVTRLHPRRTAPWSSAARTRRSCSSPADWRCA